MGTKIRVLSEKTIDQIAAGEVIESPASIVKELVENAIDALATSVKIEIHGGGHYRIRVSDDGCGMSFDDACLAFERHATSKLTQVEDLMKISSMGFRGEALAAIAACAKVEMTTCEAGADFGTKVVVHGGKMIFCEKASRKQGTTIDVSALFYNIPARKAFQKGKGPSTSDIVKMMTKLALAHPHVAIELISHEETLLRTTGEESRVIELVLGEAFTREMRPIEYAKGDFTIRGLISTPSNTRSNRMGQYILLNNRPIHSPLIAKAVQIAFSTRLSSGQYPLFVLWIALPPHFVDINVHPQKSEVRFQNDELITEIIIESLGNLFGKISFEEKKAVHIPHSAPLSLQEPTLHYQVSLTTHIETKQEITLLTKFDRFALVRFEKNGHFFTNEEHGEETIAFVDLPAMQKRLFFDEMVKAMESKEGASKQQLLFSENLQFSPAEADEVREKLPLLNQLGIGIREFGKETFVIDAISEQISLDDVKKIIEETSPKMERETIAKKMTQFAPLRTDLSEKEIVSMIKRLLKSSDPLFSPTGKRIISHFTYEKWREWFERSS